MWIGGMDAGTVIKKWTFPVPTDAAEFLIGASLVMDLKSATWFPHCQTNPFPAKPFEIMSSRSESCLESTRKIGAEG